MDRVQLSWREQLNLVGPYAYHHIKEQFIIVVPVCLYIALFQLVILHWGLAQVGAMLGGIACVFVGLAFFLEGIRIGPAPIGEIVGNALPKKHGAPVVLTFAFFLGLLASFGEPVLGTLQLAGAHLKPEHAPLLYQLLVGNPDYLVATVGLGVGLAVLIGTLRFLHGWSLKVLILPLVTTAIVLTLWAALDPVMASAIGLAWDTGAVIVGPVLCPLVLALGVGVCRASGKTSPTLAGFGMVGLISVVPITAVVLLTFVLGGSAPAASAAEAPAAQASTQASTSTPSAALPATLDFGAFYPKVRALALPETLDLSQAADRVAALPAADRAAFDAAYRYDPAQGTAERVPRMPPTVRQAALALLPALGIDPGATGYGLVARAYDIQVTDEARLVGSMTLKAGVDPALAAQVRAELVSLGWADPWALFWDSLILGARAILPIFTFLFVVMLLLKQKGPPAVHIVLSLVFAIVGLCLFFFGLSVGLGSLGNQLGDRIPAAFLDFLPLFPTDSSLYSEDLGKVIIIVFAVILGYGATLAEPAFNVLGQQVEDVTQGAFKKNLFSQAVALGVGIGAGLGILSLLYNVNLLYLLLPPYILLALLTVVNKEIYVNIAWDGGAVTTGPVTVPLKLALGLSLSAATGAGEGFGVLALASAYPVLNILILGLILDRKKKAEGLEEGRVAG